MQGADAASALTALDSFQMAHVLDWAATQHAALGNYAAAVRCMCTAVTLTLFDPTMWLRFARVLAVAAADPAAQQDVNNEVLSLLGEQLSDFFSVRYVGCHQ